MRKALILLPLLLAGCKAGRQTAVSNDGRVASSAEGGTYVAGVGKVGPEADDPVFSPDGQSLAFSSKGGATVWPWDVRVAGMGAPLAFSPDGDRLAGVFERRVGIKDLHTGAVQPTTLTEWPDGLRWTSDGRLIAFFGRQVAVDGGRTLQMQDGDLLDVRPASDGSVSVLSIEPEQAPGTDPREGTLIRWHWDPNSGKLRRESSTPIAGFTVRASGRLDLPHRYALSPDGERAYRWRCSGSRRRPNVSRECGV